MSRIVYPLAVIGGLCLFCWTVIGLAVTYNAIATRRRKHEPTPAEVAAPHLAEARAELQDAGLMHPQPDRDQIALAADRAFLEHHGIKADSLAEHRTPPC